MSDGPFQSRPKTRPGWIRFVVDAIVTVIRVAQSAQKKIFRRSRHHRPKNSPVPESTRKSLRSMAGQGPARPTDARYYGEAFAIEAQPLRIGPDEARRRRKMRRKQILLKRRMRARAWKSLRRVQSVHRRTPVKLLTAVYLGAAATGVILLGWQVIASNRSPVATTMATKPPAETPDLLASTAQLLSEKDNDRAEKNIQELLRQAPDDPRTLLAKGALEASRKNYDAARAAFQKALDVKPGLRAAVFNLAEVEFATGNYAAAETLYRKLQSASAKSDGMLCFRMYICARMQGDARNAAAILENEAVPRHSVGWLYAKSAEALLDGKKSTGRQLSERARLLYAKESLPYEKTLQRLELLP